jgi:hypothetical protein
MLAVKEEKLNLKKFKKTIIINTQRKRLLKRYGEYEFYN